MGRVNVGQISVRKDLVAIAVLALGGFLIGMLISRTVVGEPRVTAVDYAVLAGDVFQRDHDATAAADRLSSVGIARPAESVAAMADTFAVNSVAGQRDRDSLRALAAGLGRPVPATQTAQSSGGKSLWILPLVVLLMFLGLAALFVVKMLGVDFRDAAKWQREWIASIVSTVQRRSWGLRPTLPKIRNVAPPKRAATRPQPAGRPGAASRPEMRFPDRSRDGYDDGEPQLTFHARYREGDEPYDEVHPIVDPDTGRMIGACGLTAGPRMPRDGRPTHWGFSAWAQEYPEEGSSPVHAVGLVSEWAHSFRADDIATWRESDELADVIVVDAGQSVRLGVDVLSVVVTPLDLDFTPSGPPDACFSQLEVRFDVTVMQALEIREEDREPVLV